MGIEFYALKNARNKYYKKKILEDNNMMNFYYVTMGKDILIKTCSSLRECEECAEQTLQKLYEEKGITKSSFYCTEQSGEFIAGWVLEIRG